MEIDHWQDVGVDGRLILKLFLEKEFGVMDCIHLAQGRGQWGLLLIR
jgi:hypothetical protein